MNEMNLNGNSKELWWQVILPFASTVQDAIRNLDQVAVKIVLIVNEVGVLQGSIFDGHTRRGLLRGLNLNSTIASIIHRNPPVIPSEVGRYTIIELIPVVDEFRHVVGLHLWGEVTATPVRPNLRLLWPVGKELACGLMPKAVPSLYCL